MKINQDFQEILIPLNEFNNNENDLINNKKNLISEKSNDPQQIQNIENQSEDNIILPSINELLPEEINKQNEESLNDNTDECTNPQLPFDISSLSNENSEKSFKDFVKFIKKNKWYCLYNGQTLVCDRLPWRISIPKELRNQLGQHGMYLCSIYVLKKKKPPILILSKAIFVIKSDKIEEETLNITKKVQKQRIPIKPIIKEHSDVQQLHPTSNIIIGKPVISYNELLSFTKESSLINVYIDEVWPLIEKDKWIGGIGGIVWDGDHPDPKMLKFIHTHLKDNANKQQAISQAISDLINCPKAFPFVFPFVIDNHEMPMNKYWQLVVNSIAFLLGWILPSQGTQCKVNIFLEHYTEFTDGTNKTAQFEGMQTAFAISNSTGRFKRWSINKVEWVSKDFEYVPYGDTISYVIHDNNDAKELFSILKINELPGYIPMSLELLSLLRDLDVSSADGFIDALIRLASLKYVRITTLFRNVISQTFERAKNDLIFRESIFMKLEEAYAQKTRNLSVLAAITSPLLKEFPVDVFSEYPRQQIIRILIELQDANHNGMPESIIQCIENYEQLKRQLIEIDPVLCIETDLNLAVHYNDIFDFEHASHIIEFWLQKDLSLIPIEQKAKLHSSLGQSFAYTSHFIEANQEFERAIFLFSLGGKAYEEEIDQTSIYRAINSLDDPDNIEAVKLAEEVFGCSIKEAVEKLANNTYKPYHHHLLVKLLWSLPELNEEKELYLSQHDNWQIEFQHPWELILFYRALMCCEKNNSSAEFCFVQIDKIYDSTRHGAILDFIYCFIKTCQLVFIKCDNLNIEKILEKLKIIKNELPLSAERINTLYEILSGNQVDRWNEFFSLLPFNYK